MEYNGWAERYDDDTRRFGWCAPQRVLQALPPMEISTARVLDLGVGTGQCSRPLIDAGAAVVGLDTSPAMLERAAAYGYTALHEARLGEDSLRATVGPGVFDVVVSAGVLHFVSDLEGLFTEVAGLLSANGVLCFTTIPPQSRRFSDATHVRDRTTVSEALANGGLTLQAAEQFTAYYDQGDMQQPVEYEVFSAVRAAVPSPSS